MHNSARSDWNTYRFDEMAIEVKDRVAVPKKSGFERYVGLSHLDAGSLKIWRWGSTGDVEKQKMLFKSGDIIFGRRNAYLRRVSVADFDGVCSAHAMVLRARPEIALPALLPFFMQTEIFWQAALRNSAGSLSPTINWSNIAKEEFALPPLEEQHRIAGVLQAARKSEEALRYTVDTSKAVLDSFLENELDPKRQRWNEAPISDLFKVKSGGTPSRRKKEYWGGPIPWVKTGEVRYETINMTEETITEIGLKNSSAKILPIGTVIVALFGQGPTLGRVGMLGIEAATNQACACIIPNETQDSRFLYFYLQRQYERMRALARGANQPNLNLAIIKDLKIPSLFKKEQQEWVEQIQTIQSAVSQARRRLDSQRDLSQRLVEFFLRCEP